MIEIDIDLIVAYNLTIEEYVLLDLLRHKHYNKIRLYFKDNEHLQTLLNKLILYGHVKFNEFGNVNTLGDYQVSFFPRYREDKFDKMLKELEDIYPIKVTRTNGVVDYLKANHKLIKEKYKKLVKGSQTTHNHIIACLKYQIEEMTKTGRLQYLRKLINWLDREEWKEWEDRLLTSTTTEDSTTDTSNIYGNLL